MPKKNSDCLTDRVGTAATLPPRHLYDKLRPKRVDELTYRVGTAATTRLVNATEVCINSKKPTYHNPEPNLNSISNKCTQFEIILRSSNISTNLVSLQSFTLQTYSKSYI